MGKTGAAVIIQALLLGTGSLKAAMPLVFFLFVAIIAAWLRSIWQLAGDAETSGGANAGSEQGVQASQLAPPHPEQAPAAT